MPLTTPTTDRPCAVTAPATSATNPITKIISATTGRCPRITPMSSAVPRPGSSPSRERSMSSSLRCSYSESAIMGPPFPGADPRDASILGPSTGGHGPSGTDPPAVTRLPAARAPWGCQPLSSTPDVRLSGDLPSPVGEPARARQRAGPDHDEFCARRPRGRRLTTPQQTKKRDRVGRAVPEDREYEQHSPALTIGDRASRFPRGRSSAERRARTLPRVRARSWPRGRGLPFCAVRLGPPVSTLARNGTGGARPGKARGTTVPGVTGRVGALPPKNRSRGTCPSLTATEPFGGQRVLLVPRGLP